MPGRERTAEEYAADSGAPDGLREKLAREPWNLDDEDARFVVDHRYDVGGHR
jgi:hypothetical protein